MGNIIIPGFKGGQTINKYEALELQTYQNAQDLNVYADSNILKPHKLKFQDITLPTIASGSDIRVYNSFKASNNKFYFIGDAEISAVNNVVLWSTSTIAASPTYSADYNTPTATAGACLDEFNDGLYFSWGTNLDRWGNLSGTPSRSNIGTLDSTATIIRTHNGIGAVYAVHGQKIAKYDGTTFTSAALTIDKAYEVIGMEPYERWMLVGLRGKGSNKSVFYLWDGINTTIDDIIEINEIGLYGFKIVGGEIRYVCMSYGGTSGTDFIRLFKIRPGGIPQLIQERQYSVTTGPTGGMYVNATSSYGDLFFYGFKGSTYDFDLGIYAYGSGDGKYIFPSIWRLMTGGITSAVSILSINHVGDNMIVIWTETQATTYHISVLSGTNITAGSPASGIYESNIFPLNAGRMGKLKKILLTHEAISSSCGFSVYVKHYGHYPWGSTIPSPESYQLLDTPEGNDATNGLTQSANNAIMTEINNHNKLIEARYAQIKILFDEVSGTNAPGIIFPIYMET